MIITKVAHLYTGILVLSSYKTYRIFQFKFNLQELFIFQNNVCVLGETCAVRTSIYEPILTKNLGFVCII